MSTWVGIAFSWGLSRFRPQTRYLANLFSVIAISDFLHVFYEEKRTRSNVLTLREEKMSHEHEKVAAA